MTKSITWHYLDNQFDNATAESNKSMNILFEDHLSKLEAEQNDPVIKELYDRTVPVHQQYIHLYTEWKKEKGYYKGATASIEAILGKLSSSKIADWDNKIKAVVGEDTPDHLALLPNGRKSFQSGSIDNRVLEISGLKKRLESNTKLADVTSDVEEFYNQIENIRNIQQTKEALVEKRSDELEAARKEAAFILYANLGKLMDKFTKNPIVIDRFYDLQLIQKTGAVSVEEEEVETVIPQEIQQQPVGV